MWLQSPRDCIVYLKIKIGQSSHFDPERQMTQAEWCDVGKVYEQPIYGKFEFNTTAGNVSILFVIIRHSNYFYPSWEIPHDKIVPN